MKKPIVIVLIISIIVVLGLCALTTFGGYTWFVNNRGSIGLIDIDLVSATTEESRQFEGQSLSVLAVHTDVGDIQVQGTQDGSIQVRAVNKAWAENETQALAAANALVVNYEQVNDSLHITYEEPPELGVLNRRGGPDSVSFIITIPEETSVELSTNLGDLSLVGISGSAELTCKFGELSLEAIDGSVSATGTDGGLNAKGIHSDHGDITFEMRFGDMVVEDLSAGNILLKNTDGDITADNLTARDDLSVESSFGQIAVDNLSAGSFTLTNKDGNVRVEDGAIRGSLAVNSSFGDVLVTRVAASGFTLSTNDGDLVLDGANGTLNLKNRFGDITITNAIDVILALESEDGTISFSGSLDESADHTIENRFGDILLSIPPESKLSLDLKTEFGQIDSDLPLTLSGTLQETSWLATMNGGGNVLKAITNDGDISLTALVQGE
jgi:DUF4097 and DUF4098 domain-containing protein YvlB/flagellar basal body-associated protein FliL